MGKFSLGKMSTKQLWKAYGILSAVTEVLEDKLNHPKIVVKKKVRDFSNQFYTPIPHPDTPLLDNLDIVQLRVLITIPSE